MKQSFGFLLLALLLWQAPAHALLRVGIKAGVNFANISTNQDTVEYERTAGYILGVAADLAVAPALSIRTELLYAQKGAKIKRSGRQETGDGELHIEEMVVAPFLVLRYPTPSVIPFLQAGPEVGFNTLAKREAGGEERTVGDIWRNNNFSVNVGGGVIIPAGPLDFTLDARYNFGLLNLQSMQGDVETRTNGIQVFAGLNFLKL